MRRILGGVAATLLALTAVPALAADAPALLAPCTDLPAGAVALTPGKALTGDVPAPMLPGDESTFTAVVDLAGQPEGTTAAVSTVLGWTLPVNDYDLTTTGGGDSAAFNVTQTAPSESASVSLIEHCQAFTVTAVNFAAPVFVDTLTATLTATAEEPFVEEPFTE